MITQCPNPRCKLQFEVPDDRAGKNGACPGCGQVITLRSLDIIREVERRQQKTMLKSSADSASVPCFSALLEDIRSLWNVGSMFRTADGAGIRQLYLCGITGCPPNKAIAKTSLGAEESVGWMHFSSAYEILPQLKARGVQIVCLEQTGNSRPLSEVLQHTMPRPPLCLVVGNEVAGITAETLSLSDWICHLPMSGAKTSLNVAVAMGIAAYSIAERINALSPGTRAVRPGQPPVP